jgi:hypothetical protein
MTRIRISLKQHYDILKSLHIYIHIYIYMYIQRLLYRMKIQNKLNSFNDIIIKLGESVKIIILGRFFSTIKTY